MATAAQIAANRRNAQRSTGPRTEEGKERARLNAIKHGLAASTSVFLPHEDPARYHDMRAALMETWQPANAQELLLVDQICQAWWATERSTRFQNGFFNNQLRTMKTRNRVSPDPDPNDDEGIAVALTDPANEKGCGTLFRYDDRAWSKYYRAIDRLRKLQADRRKRAGREPRPEIGEEYGFGAPAGAVRCARDTQTLEKTLPQTEPQSPQPEPEEEVIGELASFGEASLNTKTSTPLTVIGETQSACTDDELQGLPITRQYVLSDSSEEPSS
jgi:hypothetical protein